MRTRLITSVSAVLLAVSLAACSGDGSSTPSSSGASTGAASTAKATPDPVLKTIEASDAVITLGEKNVGELTVTFKNKGDKEVALRAVACACAGMVQLGKATKGKDELTPISTGVPVAPGKSVDIASPTVVRLTGMTKGSKAGQKVKMTAYFGTAGIVEFEAKLKDATS